MSALRLSCFGGSLVSLILALFAAPSALAQQGFSLCGSLENGYGPYDFRTDKQKLPIVTGAHFTPMVESLIRGTTSNRPGGDIDYTLRAIPNHPNALMAVVQLGEKEKTQQPSGMRYTVECWLDRAIRFRPDDLVVRMIYVTFLTKNNRKPEAMQQLEVVARGANEVNPFTYYNLGLLYFDLGEYQKSLDYAHKASELGLERPDLRDKLKAAGKWQDPAAVEPGAAAAAPTAAASAPATP